MPKYTAERTRTSNIISTNPLGLGESSAARTATQRGKQACGTCRHRKIRCDGARPTCANCATKGDICTYVESKKRGRPAKAYTLADLALAGEPTPPLLQSMIKKHGNAPLAGLAVSESSSNGLQEQRGKVACLLCRRKKTACSGMRPTCANCAKSDSLCVYLETRKRGRRPSDNNPGNLAPTDTPLAMLAEVAAAQEPLAVFAKADERLMVLAEIAAAQEPRPLCPKALLNKQEVEFF